MSQGLVQCSFQLSGYVNESEEQRQYQQSLLLQNINSALDFHHLTFSKISIEQDTIIIECSDPQTVTEVVSKVFGIVSVENVIITEPQNESLSNIQEGVRGIPTGSQGKVVCMISGGLDSPIASFKAMKRGCVPVFVHFDNTPFGDESTKDLAIRQAQHLVQYIHGHEVKMYIIPHGDDLVDILKHAPRKMTCVFCRRNMYRLAREVAIYEDADAIVTGEIIGEQASQTTRNLLVETDAFCDVPILRPCIGYDKDDIVRTAREIGTYKFAHEAVSCCSLPPRYPSVHASLEVVKRAEESMDMGLIKEQFSRAEVLILKEGVRHG